jgi:hypothetical protein
MRVVGVEYSPFGASTYAQFDAPFTTSDFREMAEILGNLEVAGFTPRRWLTSVNGTEHFFITVTEPGVAE